MLSKLIGKKQSDNGYECDGEWKNNQRNGIGVKISNDEIYEGEWQNNMRHGKCIIKYSNDDIFEPEMSNFPKILSLPNFLIFGSVNFKSPETTNVLFLKGGNDGIASVL